MTPNERIVYSFTGNRPVVVMKVNSMRLLLAYYYKCKLHQVYIYCDSASKVMDEFTPELADAFVDKLTERLNRPSWAIRLFNRLNSW